MTETMDERDRRSLAGNTSLSPTYLRSKGLTLEAEAVEYQCSPEGKAAAELRVQQALVHIENAQHELERAAQELSGLAYASPMCTKVATLGERAHNLWRKISYAWPARERVYLDGPNAIGHVKREREKRGGA